MAKGIYCFEGEWGSSRDHQTVEPVLDLLQACEGTPFIHRNVPTEDALKFYVKRWLRLTSYPIGYFACHGERGWLWITNAGLSLDAFAKTLGSECQGKVLFFASCETMAASDKELMDLCKRTNAKGIVGYTRAVDFVEAAAMEVLLLRDLLTTTHFKPVHTRMLREHPVMARNLGLRMATKSWASPRNMAKDALG